MPVVEAHREDGRTKPAPPVRRPGSTSGAAPSWVTAWSKPTNSPGQLHDQHIKDFVARPLPPSCTPGQRTSTSGADPAAGAADAGGVAGSGGSLLEAYIRPASASVGGSPGGSRMLRSTSRTSGPGVAPNRYTPASPPLRTSTSGLALPLSPATRHSPAPASPRSSAPGASGRPASSRASRTSIPGQQAAQGADPATRSPAPLPALPLLGRPGSLRTASYEPSSPHAPSNPSTPRLLHSSSISMSGAASPSLTAARAAAAAAAATSPARALPGSAKVRGPRASLQLVGSGLDLDDAGVASSAWADEPCSPCMGGIVAGSTGGVLVAGRRSVSGQAPLEGEAGGAGAGAGGPGGGATTHHVGLAQHLLLGGSLQDFHARYFEKVGRNLHLSLGSVTFAGELDPSTGDMLRVSSRAVVLHNCSFALRPGQRLWVGPGATLVLSEVQVVTVSQGSSVPSLSRLASSATASALAAAADTVAAGLARSARTAAGAAATAAATPASPRRAPGGAADVSGAADVDGAPGSPLSPRSPSAPRPPDVPLIHVAEGGRLILRNSRVEVTPPSAQEASATPSPNLTPRGTAAAAPGAAGSARAGSARTRPGYSQLVCVLVEGGGAMEAVACRLGRLCATGEGSMLALHRCRVTGGDGTPRDAPLVHVTNGAAVQLSHVDVRDGPAQGVRAEGAGTRVSGIESAVFACKGEGVLLAGGAAMHLAECRLSSNSGGGLVVRGAGTVAEAEDCELAGNFSSNVSVSAGASVRLARSVAVGSVGGCGMVVEGRGAQASADTCSFDGNAFSGVAARQGATLELTDCSASSNVLHGLAAEGLLRAGEAARIAAAAALEAGLAANAAEAAGVRAPPPPAPQFPAPEVYLHVNGGVYAKNGKHGIAVTCGGGVKVAGAELSQNNADGLCVDGGGCEARARGCSFVGNTDSGLFVCSGGAGAADECRFVVNIHGDVAVGGRGSRGRVARCVFDYNPVTALRVHMGAKAELLACTMEPPPTTGIYAAVAQAQAGGASLGWREPWEVGGVSSAYVALSGEDSKLVVDGQRVRAQVGDEGEVLPVRRA